MLDGSGIGAYNRVIAETPTSSLAAVVSTAPQRTRRRRLPTSAEHARRVAWGRKWGSVGAEWKRNHPAKGA